MEKTIKRTNTVAFMGKDQQWHFIKDETTDFGYDEGVLIVDREIIPVDKETQAKVIEIISNQE